MTRERLLLALLGATAGALLQGVWLAAIGALLGALTPARRELPTVVGASSVAAMLLAAVAEPPSGIDTFAAFVRSQPLANHAGRLAAVALILGVADAWRSIRSGTDGPGAAPLVATGRADRTESTAPTPTIVLIAIGVSAVMMASIGDRWWWWAAIPVFAVAAVASAVVVSVRPGSTPGPHRAGHRTPSRPRWHRLRRNAVVSGSMWMLAASLAVSAGSLVFWVIAARVADQSDVGAAAALFSVVMFLNYATSLGLPILLSRFGLGSRVEASVYFTWSLVLTTLSSLLGVAVFAWFAPDTVEAALAGAPGFGWLVLALNTAGMSVSALVDVRCMTLGRWRLVFWRSVTIAVIRLPFLVLADDASAFELFVLIAGAYTFTGVVWLVVLWLSGETPPSFSPIPADVSAATRFAGVNYLGQLALQAPFFVIPVIVVATQDASTNASFYVAWGIMSVVVVAVQVVGQVLLVEGRGAARSQARSAYVVGLSVTLAALCVVALTGGVVAELYGPEYESVATLLVVLTAGTVPYTVTVVELSVARIRRNNRATVLIAVLFCLTTLTPALLLTNEYGPAGAAWAWCCGNAATAVGLLVFRRLFSASMSPVTPTTGDVPSGDPMSSATPASTTVPQDQ